MPFGQRTISGGFAAAAVERAKQQEVTKTKRLKRGGMEFLQSKEEWRLEATL
jgi:hypothetical protein